MEKFIYVIKPDCVELVKPNVIGARYKEICKAIGCEFYNTIQFRYNCKRYVMFVDDKGLLKKNNVTNEIATAIYDLRYDVYNRIAGNAAILKVENDDYGYLTNEECKEVQAMIKEII